MCTEKMRALSYIWAEKITFLPKPDGQTERKNPKWQVSSYFTVAFLLILATAGGCNPAGPFV